MNLNLSRPIVFIDLETTGTSPASDRIVEIAILKIAPDGTENFRCKRVNPGIPIPPRRRPFMASLMRMLQASRRLRDTPRAYESS